MRKRTRRGVSLIEVLVVLALLVLGILVIIRLYPSGFFSITSVGNAALADSLGQAAVQTQAQNTAGLPESILPVNSTTKDLTLASTADANYDPDDPALLDNARVINNETITIPAATGTTRQSIYVVNYGPIVMPVAMTATNLASYLSINSTYWQASPGNFNDALSATPDYPQVNIFPGQQRLLVDYTNGKVAVPYAQTYSQPFVLMVVATDPTTKTDRVYTLNFNVPASGSTVSPPTTDPHDYTYGAHPPYFADTQTYYNGGWFDPAGTNTNALGATYKYNTDSSPTTPPLPWKAVTLYRAFKGVATPPPGTSNFDADPYEFTLNSPNILDPNSTPLANVGAISFNPLGAGGSGSSALKARISYLTYSWKVVHEDRDIPALTGSDTTTTRLTLKNLKRAGDNNPDNSIYSGLIPNSFKSMIALDLDTGLSVGATTASNPVADPTAKESNINDEDLLGPSTDPTYINVSFSTGRVTFGANVFGDNINGAPSKAHRVRLFYVGDADWTVAVQKAPSYYTLSPNIVTGANDPLLQPGQYAVDFTAGTGTQNLYFPRSDAEKSVEIDGTYLVTSGSASQLKTFAGTIAIPPVVTTLGGTNYVTVSLTDPTLTGGLPTASQGGPVVSQVNVTAVRGLSVRSVVAWKERDRFKVHSVDTVLNRAQ